MPVEGPSVEQEIAEEKREVVNVLADVAAVKEEPVVQDVAAGEGRGGEIAVPPRMTSIAMVVPAALLFGFGGKGRVVREEEE